MNNKIASILKSYVETVSWADKVAGLVQTANVRIKDGDGTSDRSYPIACDLDADACIKGHYQDLAPDSKKKSVIYFEDRGGTVLERHEGNRLFYRSSLRLVCWLNLRVIQKANCDSGVRGCGTSGDYVVDIIKSLPYTIFDYDDFSGIQIEPPNQVERSVDIFSRYTYNEHATQYLMFPYDYFALDIDVTFVIPCVIVKIIPDAPIAIAGEGLSSSSFTAKWQHTPRAEGYYIDVATDSSFSNIVVLSLDVAHVDEYTFTGLASDIVYYYRVRAYNDSGESGNSNTITQRLRYTDWFLPSSELMEYISVNLFLTAFNPAGWDDNTYWTSTEKDADEAMNCIISIAGIYDAPKAIDFLCIPCREFTSSDYSVGDLGPAGGYIAYVNGLNVFEAASEVLPANVWSNIQDQACAASGTTPGTSLNNTDAITQQTGHVTSAAKLCTEYANN